MYSQEITRCHRAAIVIAVDQSSSMNGRLELDSISLTKAEAVTMVTGRLIDELILRSSRDNGYRHYYDIALVGYSGERVYSLLGNELCFYPITALAGRKVDKIPYTLYYNTLTAGTIGFKEKVSMWIKPHAEDATPMYKMICKVTDMVRDWCEKEENRDSFPPIVFNITDGETSDATDEMLIEASERLKATSTTDGNTLFVNIHLSSNLTHPQMMFPTTREIPFGVRYAQLLIEMSSVLPSQFDRFVSECRSVHGSAPYVAMSYNSSIAELIAMLSIGSRSVKIGL